MRDSGPGAHDLDVAGARATLVAKRILVGDRARADIGHDLHVAVRMRRKAALGRDLVVVPNANRAPAHALGIVIIGEGKMMAGVQPAVVGVAEAVEFADFYHGREMAVPGRPSSVSGVTAGAITILGCPPDILRVAMVPRRGLEPPRPCERQHLKLVRLPIPPPGHGASSFSAGRRA